MEYFLYNSSTGEDLMERFLEDMKAVQVLVVVCASIPPPSGYVRTCCPCLFACEAPRPFYDDDMREEIRQALHMDKLIVPVYLGGFKDPDYKKARDPVPAFDPDTEMDDLPPD
eukprot:COSAG03_NODE_8278_length_817_cov_1.630919_2_plen_112_part_01